MAPLTDFSPNKARKDGRNSYCRPCSAILVREWTAKHHEKVKERARLAYAAKPDRQRAASRRYYQQHREAHLAACKKRAQIKKKQYQATQAKWRKANADTINARQRRKRANDPERHRAYSRRYRQRHPDVAKNSVKQWGLAHPEQLKLTRRRTRQERRARLRNAKIEIVHALIVYERSNGVCGICHLAVDKDSAWHVDHIQPLSKGGTHSYENTQLAHPSCNQAKKDTWPWPPERTTP